MIVADTSVIVAMAKEGSGFELYGPLMASQSADIGAPSILETKMALSSIIRPNDIDAFVGSLVHEGGLTSIEFTAGMADVAFEAIRRFGKDRGHPAQLNSGDCMSYAVAKVHDVPLLF